MTALDPIDPENALELYLADREGNLSQSSVRSHRSRISNFVDWLDEQGITNMNELTGRLVKEYQLKGRKAGDWSPSTEKAMMDTIRVFVRWCESIEAVEGGLSERIQSPTISDGDAVRSEHLDAETAQAVLENLDMFHYSSRPHVTLAVMWNTMARRGAVRSLDLDDYDSDERSLRFEHRPDTGTPLKNKRTSERHVAISESLADLLDDWIEYKLPDVTDGYGREPLITTRNGRIAKGTISGYAYKYTQPCRYKRRCPLDQNPETCESTEHAKVSSCPESVSPHPFRRGSITHWHRSDVPSRVVSDRADVSISVEYDPDIETLSQRFEDGADLTDAEIGALVRAGRIDGDNLDELAESSGGFPGVFVGGEN